MTLRTQCGGDFKTYDLIAAIFFSEKPSSIAHQSSCCQKHNHQLVQSSIRPQFEILLTILRELLPSNTSEENLRLTAFSIVGQCLFYHFADPVIRNLLSGEEYSSLDVDKLARHITQFSLNSTELIERHEQTSRKGAAT